MQRNHTVNALWVSLGLIIGLQVQPLAAATLTWTGNTDSNWFEATNWNPDTRAPEADDTIVIPNTANGVLLTNSTPELASLTITDNTLTFDGWNTILKAATVTVESGANLTHHPNTDTNGVPGDYGSWTPDNRVYIECTDLTLHTNATINANFQGYRAPTNAPDTAWGNGPGGGYARCGGSYGAVVAQGGGGNPGVPYGSTNSPIDPGSAGAGQSIRVTEGDYNPAAGHGGGAVRIGASGVVTIFGTISVNGAAGTFRSAGGSGGSIYITCAAFDGSANGLLSAIGGNGASGGFYGSGGAGGRISVVYDTGQQSAQPGVRFAAKPGTSGNFLKENIQNGRGTVYLPDQKALSDQWNAIFDGVTLTLGNASGWNSSSLTISNSAVVMAYTGFVFTVTNELRLTGSTLIMADYGQITSGSLVLTNTSTLKLYAGATNAPTPKFGALLDVAGTGHFSGNSWIQLVSNPTNGGSPKLSFQTLTILAGSGIDASANGYWGSTGDGERLFAAGPGAGGNFSSNSRGSGGGHGGRGGDWGAGTGAGGVTNGFPYTPLWPGSGGGPANASNGGYGGGLIRLAVADELTLHGSLLANAGGGNHRGAGGAGGGIYVTCGSLVSSGTAALSAEGGNGASQGTTMYSARGGGGRIAVWIGVPASIVAIHETGGSNAFVEISDSHEDYVGAEPSVAVGGTGVDTSYDEEYQAHPGTAYFMRWTALSGSVILFR